MTNFSFNLSNFNPLRFSKKRSGFPGLSNKNLDYRYGVALLVCSILLGCSTTQPPVPVIDRVKTDPPGPAKAATAQPNGSLYTVQRGDSLYSIALAKGVDARKLAELNNITDPKSLKPGQKIMLAAPSAPVSAEEPKPTLFAVQQRPIETTLEPDTPPPPRNVIGNVETGPKALKLPYSEQNAARLKNPDTVSVAAAQPQPGIPAEQKNTKIEPAVQPEQQKNTPSPGQSDIDWMWPATGKVLSSFSKNSKGVKISGQNGQSVLASAAGEVVYSGHGLRGYGNLIIIKHNNTYLSAYAHNSKILVKEGDSVTKGQKIAEMGNSDTDATQLHFEIRKHGKPVDPLEYLPNPS